MSCFEVWAQEITVDTGETSLVKLNGAFATFFEGLGGGSFLVTWDLLLIRGGEELLGKQVLHFISHDVFDDLLFLDLELLSLVGSDELISL